MTGFEMSEYWDLVGATAALRARLHCIVIKLTNRFVAGSGSPHDYARLRRVEVEFARIDDEYIRLRSLPIAGNWAHLI